MRNLKWRELLAALADRFTGQPRHEGQKMLEKKQH
jgi:hypothetical protein